MTIRREWLNWGIFLIALGAVPLAVHWNLVDPAITSSILALWPLILVAIGIGLVLRFTPLAAIGGIFSAAIFGLLVGSVIAGGWTGVGPIVGCSGTAADAQRETRSAPFAGNRGELELELSCVDLDVNRGQTDEWVVRADFAGDRFRLDSTPERLALSDSSRGILGRGGRRAVEVSLPTSPVDGIAVDLTLNASSGSFSPAEVSLNGVGITLNASDLRIDASRAALLGGLGMTLNASSGTLAMPAAGADSGIGITLNASSLTLCVAPDLDLDINARETLSSNNFAAVGMADLGEGRWRVDAPGTGRLTIGYSANVSSITLDRTGGCP